jgi:hypothetical protein
VIVVYDFKSLSLEFGAGENSLSSSRCHRMSVVMFMDSRSSLP